MCDKWTWFYISNGLNKRDWENALAIGRLAVIPIFIDWNVNRIDCMFLPCLRMITFSPTWIDKSPGWVAIKSAKTVIDLGEWISDNFSVSSTSDRVAINGLNQCIISITKWLRWDPVMFGKSLHLKGYTFQEIISISLFSMIKRHCYANKIIRVKSNNSRGNLSKKN